MSLNREAALHWLKNMRASDWWQSQMPISDQALSAAMGKSENYVNTVLSPTKPGLPNEMLSLLSKLIPDIESRKLCFTASSFGMMKKGATRPPKFMWLDPQPVTIPRLSSSWSLWAECQACRGNQFLPVFIDEKPHFACYHCIHPTQYQAIGATPVKVSLVHEALKQYY